jgi:transcriptional regulator with XRE-family HTH domain
MKSGFAADGAMLRRRRRYRGLSQDALGKLAGISDSMVGNLETGAGRASPKVAFALAQALGFDDLEAAIDEGLFSEVDEAAEEVAP